MKKLFRLLLPVLIITLLCSCGKPSVEDELRYFYGSFLYTIYDEYCCVSTIRSGTGGVASYSAYPLDRTDAGYIPFDTEKVNMTAVCQYADGNSSVLVTIENRSESQYLSFGKPYMLEKEISDVWYEISALAGYDGGPAISIPPGASYEYEIEPEPVLDPVAWEHILQGSDSAADCCIPLSPGHYRVVQGTSLSYFYDEDAAEDVPDEDRFNLIIEFDIEDRH